MAVHVLSGVMGSGKSYEAVKEKLLPALIEGRRIITNIEGINPEAIAAYLKLPLDTVTALLVLVDYERPLAPKFYYSPECPDALVQPGDLVLLDECWRYFPKTAKVAEDAMLFVRMHRHYVHADTGLSCEIVFINQTLSGLHKDISSVAEVEYRCRKLKALGRPQNYQVFVYEAGERKASHRFIRKYDSAIFPLYKSYSGKAGQESLDKRQNALNTPFFKYVLPAFLLFMPVAGYHVYKSMSSGFGQVDAAQVEAPAQAPRVSASAAGPAAVPASAPPGDWRLVATHKRGDMLVATVVNAQGLYRTMPVSSFVETGPDIAVAVPPLSPGYAGPFTGQLLPKTQNGVL